MKSNLSKISSIFALALAFVTGVPNAQATDVTLDSAGFYDLSDSDQYFPLSGPRQSGRYNRLGDDYYRSAEIGVDFITNHSYKRSGSLSFEFWGMPFYGATSGIVLMTRGVSPLYARDFYSDVVRGGQAISLDERRFPELSLWEYTLNGWRFRDALSFRRANYL